MIDEFHRSNSKTLTRAALAAYEALTAAIRAQGVHGRLCATFAPACFTDYVPPAPSLGPPDDGLMPSQRAIINATRKYHD